LGAPVYSGLINDGSPFYTESLLILPGTPEPVLAATGVEAAPVVAGALGLVVLGGAALVLRRRAA
jgi:LPXTG-motif cell wall-anchored protein